MNLDLEIRGAVRHFWQTRRQQQERAGGDQGLRTAVTAGRQMDGFSRRVGNVLLAAGVPEADISMRARLELPGWFRAEKKWDLVVVRRGGDLVVAIETKSHAGPSFGNNFNNRAEEAIGSASDLWAAYREGVFRPSVRPLLGYLMVVEDSPQSRAPVGTKAPHFSVLPEFANASYCDRYKLLVLKLLRERLYDAAGLIFTSSDSAESGDYTQPSEEATFESFANALRAAATRAYGGR